MDKILGATSDRSFKSIDTVKIWAEKIETGTSTLEKNIKRQTQKSVTKKLKNDEYKIKEYEASKKLLNMSLAKRAKIEEVKYGLEQQLRDITFNIASFFFSASEISITANKLTN